MIRRRLAMLVAALVLLTPAPAGADTLFPMTRERSVERAFEITGCGATSELTVTAPRGASRVSALRPTVGSDILDAAEGAIFARVTGTVRAGRTVRFTATGVDAACRPPVPDCADDECPRTGTSEPVELTIRYTRKERVYVTGTGRGGSRAYKPRVLPFGQRSAIIGLRWRGWGSARAVGRGRVEFNSCVPDCARARPAYYPVRATLSRRRACNGYAQYLTLRFVYTTSARPPGLPRTYSEQFGSGC